MLFESNQMSIPEEFNAVFVELLIKFFYFKEIPPIALKDLFQFFHLAFFMKVEPITIKILEFFHANLTDINKATIIYKGLFEFIYFFKEDARKLIDPLLADCIVFFNKNSYFNEFFMMFDQRFFENMKENLEEMFVSLLNPLKA